MFVKRIYIRKTIFSTMVKTKGQTDIRKYSLVFFGHICFCKNSPKRPRKRPRPNEIKIVKIRVR